MPYYSYTNTYLIILIRKAALSIGLCAILVSYAYAQNIAEIQLANEYLIKGDKNKAHELYRDLSKDNTNIALIHNNYINVLLDLDAFDEALTYLKRIIKKEPDNIQYRLDVGIVYMRSGEQARAEKYFSELIEENKSNVPRIKMVADYLAAKSLADYSILALTTSRQFLGNPYLFSLDLAMLYRITGKQDKMVQEYLNYVTQTSANIQYVKNVMQTLLTKPEELESLEKLLYDRVQQYPDMEVYADLLIWVTMQQKNFYASFIQARAYDKRYTKDGEKSMEVARVALDNDDYDNALRIYQYVAKEYPNSQNYLLARLGQIRTREARIRKSFPVNIDSVQTLVNDYEKFIRQYPDNNNALEASRIEASLVANFLNQKEEAVEILNKLIANPRASIFLKSKAKLDLGDIYLTSGEPWEATLLYSQVEKTQKESPIAYEAKLKNAKLSYYKGDFKLAQEHLDILKQATTREISNDAMDLSMRIKENTLFDTLGEALKQYAFIELLLYQNKTAEALQRIQLLKEGNVPSLEGNTDSIATKMIAISNQTILDDVYWLEANLRMKQGEFNQSISLLQKIMDEYGDDVLADDAYFLQGEIYERQLHETEKAKEIYREFLNKFPGSVYAAEARKRYRILRGDFTNTEQPQL